MDRNMCTIFFLWNRRRWPGSDFNDNNGLTCFPHLFVLIVITFWFLHSKPGCKYSGHNNTCHRHTTLHEETVPETSAQRHAVMNRTWSWAAWLPGSMLTTIHCLAIPWGSSSVPAFLVGGDCLSPWSDLAFGEVKVQETSTTRHTGEKEFFFKTMESCLHPLPSHTYYVCIYAYTTFTCTHFSPLVPWVLTLPLHQNHPDL